MTTEPTAPDAALLWAREHMLEGASERAVYSVALAFRAGQAHADAGLLEEQEAAMQDDPEQRFMDEVWSALKADATDLGKQQRILASFRAIIPMVLERAAQKVESLMECDGLIDSDEAAAAIRAQGAKP